MSSPALPWRVIGRYALFDEVASGGMATVYMGRLGGPAGFSRTVACKRLHPHLARTAEFRERFLQEARLAARVRHSNVVSIIDVVQEDDDVFLVMEYVMGVPLSKLLGRVASAGSAVPPAIASGILVPVLRGLHAAHETLGDQGEPLGLIHRDVSPQNVLVGADGVPRVLDFGIAKAGAENQGTQDGVLKGKVGYLAPEQIRGEPLDRRVDVYSASVVLWEMLTGERLFKPESAEATMRAILEQPIAKPGSRVAGIPPRLDAVVLQGLARDPSIRFQSAQEMADVLENAVAPSTAAQLSNWVTGLAGRELDELRERLKMVETASDDPAPASAIPLRHGRKSGSAPAIPYAGSLEAQTQPARRVSVQPAGQAVPRGNWGKLALLIVALAAVLFGISVLHRVAVSQKDGGTLAMLLGSGSAASSATLVPSASVSSVVCAPKPLTDAISVASSGSARHTCALRDDHSVWCWGANDKGQLGLGISSTDPVPFATRVGKLEPSVELAAGGDLTAVVLGDTHVATWGKGLVNRPAIVEGLDDVQHVTAGGRHTCAVKRRGAVLCWGDGESGQLGSAKPGALLADPIETVRYAVSIAAGTSHTCAVVPPDGGVYCWGDNTFGQLGLGTTDRHPHPMPMRVPAVLHMAGVAAGDKTTFAWTSQGTAMGWGFGIKQAVQVPMGDVAQVGAGGKHNCLTRKDGTVYCWGFNDFGQLGPSSESDSAVPVQIPGLEDMREVVAGDQHACALYGDGRVACWGGNEAGQLGQGTTDRDRHATPRQVLISACP